MQIKIKTENSEFNRKFLANRIHAEMAQASKYFAGYNFKKKTHELAFYAYDGDEIIGGITANINLAAWAEITALFIAPKYRGLDLASRLIERLETTAKAKGCLGIIVQVWSCQPRAFFEKFGFKVFGRLNNCPQGESLVLLQKTL